MWKKVVFYIILLLVLLSNNAFSQDFGSNLSPGNDVTLVIVRQMHLDNLIYTFDIDGINMYMDYIEFENPELYSDLSPTVDDLVFHNTASIVAGIIPMALGIGCTVYGFTIPSEGDNGMALHWGMILGGFAGFTIGSLIIVLLRPGDKDFYKFVNRHNQLNPDNTIEVY